MTGTDLARREPQAAARLVARTMLDNTGTTRNAWEVLVSAWGEVQASILLRATGARDLGTLIARNADDLPGYTP